MAASSITIVTCASTASVDTAEAGKAGQQDLSVGSGDRYQCWLWKNPISAQPSGENQSLVGVREPMWMFPSHVELKFVSL
jgi:hypothetical protein